jgi:hypothetical protein
VKARAIWLVTCAEHVTVEIKAIVQNRGQGEAGSVTAKVDYDNSLFFMGKNEFNL